MKNTIVDNGNGTSTMIIDSKTYGMKHVLIDTHKIADIKHIKWCINRSNTTKAGPTFYVTGFLEGKSIKLHRVLLNTPAGFVTDHINGNTLDNTLSNLRAVTNQENGYNQKRARGFALHKASGKFQAYIKKDGILYHLGLFETAPEARAAYITAKLQMHIIN
jgi:hypothetical protein